MKFNIRIRRPAVAVIQPGVRDDHFGKQLTS